MKLGSLCTGYGGLDLAAEAHYGAETVWVGEYNPQASAVLEHRFPVPNLTDLTAVDWSTVEPVDVLTAGYPCQPFSHAGRRKGTEDDRHIWPHIADAVRVLRPGRVVLENVAGHLSLGFSDVLGDLAALGYDTRWCCVRASDAGAPHRRERVFIVAVDADGGGHGGRAGEPRGAGHRQGRIGRATRTGEDSATDTSGERRPQDPRGAHSGQSESRRAPEVTDHVAGRAREERHEPDTPPDTLGVEPLRRHGGGGLRGAAGTVEGEARQRQRARDAAGYRREVAPDADHIRREGSIAGAFGDHGGSDPRPAPDADGELSHRPGVERPGRRGQPANSGNVDWGVYAAAIHRWEHTLGRSAPAPTDNAGRLNPRFVEWMMGLPDGWVTDLIPQRTHALRILGNGVVPQQAALALAMLDPDRATS